MKKTEQKVLLQLARATIVAQVNGQPLPGIENRLRHCNPIPAVL
jgi:hypothetical protein